MSLLCCSINIYNGIKKRENSILRRMVSFVHRFSQKSDLGFFPTWWLKLVSLDLSWF